MAELNLTIPTGVTWRRLVVRKDAQGNRIASAGMHGKMDVRQRPGAPPILTISTEAGTILLEHDQVEGSAVGVVTLRIPGPLSDPISAQAGVYDVKLWSDTEDGEPSYRILEGTVAFDLAVTR